MMVYKKTMRICDQRDRSYEIELRHYPHFGYTNAFYLGNVIAQRESYRLLPPYGESDAEHEAFEERFGEWIDEVESDLLPMCIAYFDRLA